jgi:hypothetical protein
MLTNAIREKVENIIRGVIIAGTVDNCTTTRNFLCASYSTSKTVKRNFESQRIIKKKQEAELKVFATENNLWVNDLPGHSQYITRGGESRRLFRS